MQFYNYQVVYNSTEICSLPVKNDRQEAFFAGLPLFVSNLILSQQPLLGGSSDYEDRDTRVGDYGDCSKLSVSAEERLVFICDQHFKEDELSDDRET